MIFAAASTSASGQDDRRVQAAHLGLGRDSARGRRGGDAEADAGGAGEGDDVGELDDGLAGLAAAGDDVEDALRQVLAEDLLEQQPAGDRVPGRLEHDGVAVGERRRGLPQRDREREVPRRDQPRDAARAAAGDQQRAQIRRRRGGVRVAVRVQRRLRLVAQDPHGAAVLADRLGQRLADLADHQIHELVLGGVDGRGRRVQRVGARERVAAPLALRGPRALEGGGDGSAVGGRSGTTISD